MKALFLVLFLALAASAQVKKPEPPAVKPEFSNSLQAVVVTTDGWDTTQGRARLFERKDTNSKWKAAGEEFVVSVGRSGMAWEAEFVSSLWINDAPTLTPVFKTYCEAWVKKDDAALRTVYSAQTLVEFEREMKEEGITSLRKFLQDDGASIEFCEASNEAIVGDVGIAEVRTKGYPNGITAVFAKEAGDWKLTNKLPDVANLPIQISKKEGDGRSPAGLMPLTYAFGKTAKVNTKLKYLKVVENTECIDDVNSNHYNKIVNRMQVGAFDWKSSEKMFEITPEYDLGVFVAYNSYPAVKGRGSCIFLHIWESPGDATSGCTAMSREDLERVVSWLDPKKNPYLIQMPAAAYKHYEKTWKLPNLK